MTENIQYIGELLWPGKVGHYLLVTAFVTAIISAISYYKATQDEEQVDSWKKLGRYSFYIHGVSVIGAIVILFTLMLTHRYEYNYVWASVSEDLPFGYMFAAFWEDQEGSFLLWTFWQIIISVVFIRVSSRWEASTMWIMALIQVFLSSMVLGVVIGDLQIGSSPFNLLRAENSSPIFEEANYLELIEGRGLNPLLQNYWMVIHPPTLFLGFALCSLPFSIVCGALADGKYTGWTKVALKWASWAGGVLGVGILMGSAWAYEALSFGGYWAWDPVENSSLVPWILVVAGIHTNLIAKSTGRSFKLTFWLYVMTFIMVLYSTFLTRSGLTSESSAHAFTSSGMEGQLLAFILFFIGLGVWMYVKNRRHLPVNKDDEPFWSREFWMYLGSFVLILSTILITFTTSIPVFNEIIDIFGKISGKDLSEWHRTTPLDPIAHYNRYQLWIAVLIGLMAGTAQFLRYRERNYRSRFQKIGRDLLISLIITLPLGYIGLKYVGGQGLGYVLLMFTATYGVISNLAYLLRGFSPNSRKLASVFSHAGFGIMIWGIMASGLQKTYISTNPFVMKNLVEDEKMANENILLYKGLPMRMSNYEAIYYKDTLIRNQRFYSIKFVEFDEDENRIDSFELSPSSVYANDFTEIVSFNPSTDHRLGKDIFTSISALPPEVMKVSEAQKRESELPYENYDIPIGDTIYLRDQIAILKGVSFHDFQPDYRPEEGDLAVSANVLIIDPERNFTYLAKPTLVIKDHRFVVHFPEHSNETRVKVRLGEEFIDMLFPKDEDLDFHKVVMKKGETVEFDPYTITLNGLHKEVTHPDYQEEEGDIVVQAELTVRDRAGQTVDVLEPVFIIRQNQPNFLRDYQPNSGLAANFVRIDPQEEKMEFFIGERKAPAADREYAIRIAEDVPRNDFIVLEAIVFPGINLFWIGSSVMMAGFFISVYARRNRKKVQRRRA